MTQPRGNDRLDVEGHLRAIGSPAGQPGVQERLFTAVLAQESLRHNRLITTPARGADPVMLLMPSLRGQGYEVNAGAAQGNQADASPPPRSTQPRPGSDCAFFRQAQEGNSLRSGLSCSVAS